MILVAVFVVVVVVVVVFFVVVIVVMVVVSGVVAVVVVVRTSSSSSSSSSRRRSYGWEQMRYEWFEEVCSIRSNDIREQHGRARPIAADEWWSFVCTEPLSGRCPRRLRSPNASICGVRLQARTIANY